jgi:hypothetical protein
MQIKGLYVIWNESPETPYLIMVSLDEEKLKTFLSTLNINNDEKYIINEVKLFVVSSTIKGKILFSRAIGYSDEFIKDKIFAMNQCKSNYIDQVLLKIVHDSDETSDEYKNYVEELRNNKLFEENTFSNNLIKYDTYYVEGLLNN